MKRYLFTEIVEKVHLYTGNNLSNPKHNGLMVIAKIIEENRLEIHKHIHNARVELENINNIVNGNFGPKLDKFSCYDHWSSTLAAEANYLNSAIITVNRLIEYLFEPLKEMLAPVWKVYWNEGCNTVSNIVMWLEKADSDNGEKVFLFLHSKSFPV